MVSVQDNVCGLFLSAGKDLHTEIKVLYTRNVWKSPSEPVLISN